MTNKYLDVKRADALAMINLHTQEEQPVVDIIMCSMRPELIGRIADNINCQKANIGKVIIVPQNYTPAQLMLLETKIKNKQELIILNLNNDISLGTKHQLAHNETTADYVSVMDDDDIYFPNYLKGQLNCLLNVGKPAIVSIANPIGRNEVTNDIGFLLADIRYKGIFVGAGGSMVYHREIGELVGFKDVKSGYDNTFQTEAYNSGYKLINSLPFNFIVTRGRNDHTWNLTRKTGISFNNIKLEEVEL